ncbi:TetR/AcrR family transcriptional regulator [Mycobacterium sp. Y57]|uniref:TetR/AcrR family transcriptional regulator n=1 Tax=Mycolicibacterium xanthum TaxID=2796469 RepID=UPI001C865C72|nr:TetR/AcrR family transcriptional regulator [Mycolicibacterium xanthum]MBX7433924.1 TetR/AcrR family transcriptional regulator [Mycolicibacterium xanthum]
METPPTLGRPVGAHGDATRRRILAATMRCVTDLGYAKATIREIARTAGMTSGSLYHYFPTKTELIRATFEELADFSMPRIAAAAARETGFRDRLMAVLEECDRVMRDYPLLVAFDHAVQVGTARELEGDVESVFTPLRDVLINIVEQASQERCLHADVDSSANAIFLVLRGLTHHGATASPEDYDATVDALKKLVSGTLFD